MIFAIDFDGTLTTKNSYPETGEPNWPIVEKVKDLKAQGHELCLWTCRQGDSLKRAVDFCRDVLGIDFDYVNTTAFALARNYQPVKLLADYYIDDKAMDLDKFLNTKDFN